jgi:hypothetical protein
MRKKEIDEKAYREALRVYAHRCKDIMVDAFVYL